MPAPKHQWKPGLPSVTMRLAPNGVFLFLGRNGKICHGVIGFREKPKGNGSFLAIEIGETVTEIQHSTDIEDALGIGPISHHLGPLQKPR